MILLGAAVVIAAATLQAFDRGIDPLGTALTTATTDDEPTPTTRRSSVVTTTTPTTIAARPPLEVKVIPINGTNIAGVAGRTGDVLRRAGYNVLAPTNMNQPVQGSSVQFAAGRDADAREVAKVLGLLDTAVSPLPSPIPPAYPDIKGADVVVIVGPDLAARTAPATTTTVRRATTTTGVRPISTTSTTRATVPPTTTTTVPG